MNVVTMDPVLFEKAQLVGTRKKDKKFNLAPLQAPMHVEDGLTMIIQFEDLVSKKSAGPKFSTKSCSFETFRKKFEALNDEEITQACSIQDKYLFACLAQFVPCVGCRRGVEQLFQQVQNLNNSVFDCIKINSSGTIVIDPMYANNPQKLFYLFNDVKKQLYEVVTSFQSNKRNKRCIFHSLKLQKPNDLPTGNKQNLPKWCTSSILDVWDGMCNECQKAVSCLDLKGIMDTMEHYLKKHRFCCECKSNVMKALNILTHEIDGTVEPGYCSAIYEGFQFCSHSTLKNDNQTAETVKHVHVCCERSFIIHSLTQADAEMGGGDRERHAKTIDIAQEEVCTCLALYLHQRLHRVWHVKLTMEQSWLTLLFLSIEAARQNFESMFELKAGYGQMEALCKEIEEADREKESKLQKKRLKRRRQQKRRKGQKCDALEELETEENLQTADDIVDVNCSTDKCPSHTEFSCLLNLFKQDEKCDHSLDGDCEETSLAGLTQEEILEFERNRSEINAQRTRLRERIRQDFENFCNVSITSSSS
uniref:Gametogenetin-binding protein 2 n=1 Tax=Phallusia mammillata TaxID=59560 RepID=A0A6F9DEE8_9ASCI|nr:gametogenetin-binding protein 2-like [Phallusia mammillata]